KNLVAEKRLEEARTYYSQLIAIEPKSVEWLASRAQVQFKLDDLQEALLDAKRIVDLQPNGAMGFLLQAEAHDGLRERSQAIVAYGRVLQLEPGDQKSKERIQFLESELRKEALLRHALQPDKPDDSPRREPAPRPELTFDPTLFDNPAIP